MDFFDKMRKVRNKACHTAPTLKEDFYSFFLPLKGNIKIKQKYLENNVLNMYIYLLHTIESKYSINFQLIEFNKIFL